jgi:plasmid replication initiation protein
MTKKLIIKQSSQLTEAAYSLARDQKRVLYLVLSQMSQHGHQNGDGVFYITTSDYARAFACSSNHAARDIPRALASFKGAEVVLYLPDRFGELQPHALPWLVNRAVRSNHGEYKIEINHNLLPFMYDWQQAHFFVEETQHFSSAYSLRVFELIKQHSEAGEVTRPVAWFIERYELPASYQRLPDFRRRFLFPVVNELNTHLALNVSVEEVKTGRTTTAITLRFGAKNELKAPICHT